MLQICRPNKAAACLPSIHYNQKKGTESPFLSSFSYTKSL
ncbi:Uncharacterized protein dnm_057630 [Desulfonema magnum]|uniref:Uncharacterized protein n=1 Tax=Desulfonema magnum TaxID=45655 RepID=A0A975BQC6_9BACT|nr:Uncharacterized protein dnm_057630 [Desulfonema magnum]